MSRPSQTREQPRIVVDPVCQAFLDDLAAKGGPPIYTLPVPDARRVLETLQAGNVPKPPADTEDRTIPIGPRGQLGIRIVRPQGVREALPPVMYFHGGGWVLGSKNTHDRLVREIASGAHVAVVFVEFTPSPEAHYPVPIEEAYAATRWVAENGRSINVDPSRLAVAGDSVGGNMATVVALLAKERGGPRIAYQVLFYPVTDASFDTASYQQFATGYWLSREAMKWFWDQYASDVAMRSEPTASPLRASLEQLRGLPPALVTTNECDVLRDEGECYAHKLVQAGVRVTAARYLSAIHDLVMLDALAESPAARATVAQANDLLQKALAPEAVPAAVA